MEQQHPKVGIGVFIVKDDKLLLHKRKGSHGPDLWSGPGGHLDMGESFEACAKRETMEEAGIEIENVRVLCMSNLLFPEGKHYVDLGVIADWKSGEPSIMEPDKNEGWEWFTFDTVPPDSELFGAMRFYIDTYLGGEYPIVKDSE